MKQPTVVINLLLLALLAGTPPSGAGNADPQATPADNGGMPAMQQESALVQDADLDNGRTIAMGGAGVSNACFTCHGISGEGAGISALPRLAGQSAFYLYKQLEDYAAGTRENDVMGPIAKALDDSEMKDVAAYYASLENIPYAPAPEADPFVLQHGGSLSAIGDAEREIEACANCHGPGGIGTPPLFPYLAGQHAAYLELQLLEWKRGRRGNDSLGVMEYIAERMTDEDIRAVALYFESVRPDHPEAQRDGRD